MPEYESCHEFLNIPNGSKGSDPGDPATRADVSELEPVNAYTDADMDYDDDNSRVVREHDNPDEQNIELTASTVENWDEYDTVFVGYSNWLAYYNLIQCTQA